MLWKMSKKIKKHTEEQEKFAHRQDFKEWTETVPE